MIFSSYLWTGKGKDPREEPRMRVGGLAGHVHFTQERIREDQVQGSFEHPGA